MELLWAGKSLSAASPAARPGPSTSRPFVLTDVRPYNIRAEPSGAVGPSHLAGSRNAAPAMQPPLAAASRPPPDAGALGPGSQTSGYDSRPWSWVIWQSATSGGVYECESEWGPMVRTSSTGKSAPRCSAPLKVHGWEVWAPTIQPSIAQRRKGTKSGTQLRNKTHLVTWHSKEKQMRTRQHLVKQQNLTADRRGRDQFLCN